MNDKRPVAWQHATVGQTALFTEGRKETLTELVPEFMTGVVLWGARTFSGAPSLVEGSKQLRYDIPNIEVKYAVADEVVHTGIWRSVGHSQNAFVLETFIDELATRAGEDPYRFRRDLLSKSPRHLGVLDLAAEKAGWGKTLPVGRALGIAVHESFDSFCAMVAEVSIENHKPRVHRVVVGIDVGVVIYPDGVKAQVESGIVFGLSSAIKQEAITIENGVVAQSNFHDFEVLRIEECPDIEVHLVESDAPPTGCGETTVPPISPAVANGLFVLTQKRIREMPFPRVG